MYVYLFQMAGSPYSTEFLRSSYGKNKAAEVPNHPVERATICSGIANTLE